MNNVVYIYVLCILYEISKVNWCVEQSDGEMVADKEEIKDKDSCEDEKGAREREKWVEVGLASSSVAKDQVKFG